MIENIAAMSGLLATIWISAGVYIAAKFYPNYDHINQFCSELGAKGSPTEKLSPLINNYPLGLIFCLFGWYLCQLPNSNWAISLVGFLIIIHGVGTWVAGYFPMDKDPYTLEPTKACKIHSWAGFFMLLSLLAAPVIVAFSPASEYILIEFRVFSLVVFVAAIYFLLKMAKSFKVKQKAGLYQRISYWIKLFWLASFSLLLTSV